MIDVQLSSTRDLMQAASAVYFRHLQLYPRLYLLRKTRYCHSRALLWEVWYGFQSQELWWIPQPSIEIRRYDCIISLDRGYVDSLPGAWNGYQHLGLMQGRRIQYNPWTDPGRESDLLFRYSLQGGIALVTLSVCLSRLSVHHPNGLFRTLRCNPIPTVWVQIGASSITFHLTI